MNQLDGAVPMRSRIEIPPDHAAYSGHFPGRPILPGALLLDEAVRIIECARALDLLKWQIASAKFLEFVRPGDPLSLEHEAPVNGLIRFTIRAANRPVVTGTLSAAQDERDDV
jgi:3-hydroxymyristoyl/3-hydroxydecanoyl-(acyl carrier protein) dehydratase